GLIGSSITSNPWVRIIGGVVIIVFGLQMMGVLKIGALYRDTRKFSEVKPRGLLGSFALGLAFAAGWTPCIGPILGGIIGLAATSGGWQNGLLLSAFYAAGLSIPFLITGLGINKFLGFYGRFRRHLHKVEVVSGVILIVIGILVATNSLTFLASGRFAALIPNPENWLQKYFPEQQSPATPAGGSVNKNTFPLVADYELKTLDGQPYRLSQLRGKVVLLNFWATWCLPCRSEIPALNALQRDLGPSGFEVVGVSNYDDADAVREFQQDLPQEYQVLVGGEEANSAFGTDAALPQTYIIDREGRVRQKMLGEKSRAAFEAAVRPLLAEAQAARRNDE
ncbi:MAG: cytochrome c biogenesis protein CcdA, partial [Pyrinomonadaceae bacterium]